MDDKSHVSMGFTLCPVCAFKNECDTVLLDKRLKATLSRETFTGWKMCEAHEKLRNEYIALIGCDYDKSTKDARGNITLEGAYRTGDVVHIRRDAFRAIIKGHDDFEGDFMFIDPNAIEKLKEIAPHEQESTDVQRLQ
jgi:hypothetical protein